MSFNHPWNTAVADKTYVQPDYHRHVTNDGNNVSVMAGIITSTFGGMRADQYALVHIIQGILSSEREIEMEPKEVVKRAKAILQELTMA